MQVSALDDNAELRGSLQTLQIHDRLHRFRRAITDCPVLFTGTERPSAFTGMTMRSLDMRSIFLHLTVVEPIKQFLSGRMVLGKLS